MVTDGIDTLSRLRLLLVMGNCIDTLHVVVITGLCPG